MISCPNISSPLLLTTQIGELSPAGPPINLHGLQWPTGPLLELITHFNTHLWTLTVSWSLSWALRTQTRVRNAITALEKMKCERSQVRKTNTKTRGCKFVAWGPNMAPRCVLFGLFMLLKNSEPRFFNWPSFFCFNNSSFYIVLKALKSGNAGPMSPRVNNRLKLRGNCSLWTRHVPPIYPSPHHSLMPFKRPTW